jgi:hypothetical protein
MNYEIVGRVVESETGQGVSGVAISAFDRDPLFDDPLGEVLCDERGRFRIAYDERSFRDLFEKAPDVYVTVKTLDGKLLYTSRDATRKNASKREEFEISLPRAVVDRVGLSTIAPPPSGSVTRSELSTLTCLEGAERDDLVKQIEADLTDKASVLEIFKQYMGELRGKPNNDALPFRKMARLFELGKTPDRVSGHHYGLVPGLRTGDLGRNAAEIGNAMGLIWGKLVGDITPWVGKTFTPISGVDRKQVVAELPAELPVFRGINHFNVIERAPVNVAINSILEFLWGLKDATMAERLRYGYDKNGGHFAAHRARSIHPSTPREVFRLNYRYEGLGNAWPLKYLIDEVVEIAAGLYLGQVLFATDHLLEPYDPRAPHERYHYQHFGYFLMLTEAWVPEARRLFPYLEIPEVAAGTRIVGQGPVAAPRSKFSTLTLAPPGDGPVDARLLAKIKTDLVQAGSLIRLFKAYSETLEQELDVDSPVFDKLATLFNAGIGPEKMNGFYRGALVAWQSQGLLALGGINNIQGAWLLGRQFSPWTGKRFDPIDPPRLLELTDGHEKAAVPTFFCANTVVFRTAKERFTGQLARALDLWVDEASEEERRLYGYDAKTFFFIGKQAPSIYPPNQGKRVFQFNYRWQKLRNPVPDRFCIDELVQIAEGLYLGQVFYSTNWLEPWDPATEVARYKYDLFEYFLVMDEEWHAERLRIGYDLVNV